MFSVTSSGTTSGFTIRLRSCSTNAISHIDILYQPDSDRGYGAFWNDNIHVTKIPQVDLRQLALVLIVIAFGVLLDYDPTSAKERRGYINRLGLDEQEKNKMKAMIIELEADSLP